MTKFSNSRMRKKAQFHQISTPRNVGILCNLRMYFTETLAADHGPFEIYCFHLVPCKIR